MGDVHEASGAVSAVGSDVAAGRAPRCVTAWPPNWLRIAAIAFIAGLSSWREANRANSEAAMTCIGDGVVDRGLDGPAALAGVLGVAGDLVEVGVLLERGDQQVEQPGADHGARAPGVEDLGDVVDQVDLLEQLPALGVGLHHGVLDAVVDHLGEVAGAGLLAGVHEAALALGLERVEGRLDLGDVLVGAAAHQRVAVLSPQTPPETPQSTKPTPFSAEHARR